MESTRRAYRYSPLLGVCFLLLAAGCAPRVEVSAPTEPIEINLNVKIEHEIIVKVDKDLEDLFDEEEELF